MYFFCLFVCFLRVQSWFSIPTFPNLVCEAGMDDTQIIVFCPPLYVKGI